MDVHNPEESTDDGAELWVIGNRYVWGLDLTEILDSVIDESADEKSEWGPFAHAVYPAERMHEFFEETREEMGISPDDADEFDEDIWERVYRDVSVTSRGTDYNADELHLTEQRLVWSPSNGTAKGEEDNFYEAVAKTLGANDNAIYLMFAEWVADYRPDDEPLETRELPPWVRAFVTETEDGLESILAFEDETEFLILNDSDLPPWQWRGSYMGGAPKDQLWGAFFREEEDLFTVVSSAKDPDTYQQMVELSASLEAVS